MANELQRAGAASKPTRYASLWTNRMCSGLWTQRSPLRDAASTRYEEKFLGARGDALIDGLNTELTNRLTLARRPGCSVFNSADIGTVDSFYSFRYYNGSSEKIKVMADTASTIYDATATNTVIFSKSNGAGASTFKSIGNTLFWGDGVDQKKWLTSPPWKANTTYTTGQFIVDQNNNVQEAVAPTGVWAVSTAYTVGQYIVDNNGNIQQVTTAGTSGTSQPAWAVTVGATTDDGTGTLVWTCIGDSGTTGATQPTWPTTYGSTVSDGTVNWMCMGNAVQNWGTAYPTAAPTNQASAYAGSDCRYWSPNTSVTAGYTVLDPNGYIQLMSTFAPIGGRTLSPTLVANSTAEYNAYMYPEKVWDGDPTTFSYLIMQHIGRSGSCTWGFSSYSGSTPPVCRINILSEIPHNGEVFPGVDRTYADDGNYWDSNRAVIVSNDNAQLSYSTDSGSTWTNIYTAGGSGVGRPKQWDAVTLPSGTNPASVQIKATTNAHDDMCHYVYEINMVIEEDIGISGGALTTGSSVPKWSTTLYGVTNDGTAHWINCGTISAWQASTLYTYTTPTASIVDTNGNLQVLQNTGTSGTTAPTWALTPGSTSTDGTLTWLNCGSGTVAAYSGWTYAYAYHCVDGHVSTASPASYSTGPVMGNIDVPLSGVGSADPQVDAVWLFRTVDGGSTFLFMEEIPNPGVNGTWNLKDTNPDDTLNLFIQAAIDDANDPPPVGSIAPEYHLGRVWVGVGNTVYYSQSYTSVGVAVQSFPPLNYFIFPSIVTRMVSTPSGLLVFTVSDVFVILGTGIDSVFFVTDFIDGVGLLHYHALAINGSTPMLLTSDGQFLAITTDGGVSELGFPIGNLLEKFNPATAYVSWHVDGSQDKAIYVSDGSTGWYRCNPTSTPETGLVWSPFAALTGGCSAVQSIEVTPGVHRLLVGGTFVTEQVPVGNPPNLTPPVTVPAGQNVAWSLPTTVGVGDQNYPGTITNTNGSAVGSLTGGTITMTSSGGLGNWFFLDQWGGFNAPPIPEGATVTGIYPVITCSHAINLPANGSAESQVMGGVDMSPTAIEPSGLLPVPGGAFTSATYYGESIGTDLGLLASCSIVARFFETLGEGGYDDVLSVTGVGIAVSYTGAAITEPVQVGTPILKRDLTVWTDNGTAYESNAVIGSIVLAYPGQLAEVVFLTYDSPKIAGANLPLLGVILDEALPYYTGDFTTLNNIVNDPPLLPPSSSLSSNRAYMSQSQLPAWCRSLQVKVDFGADAYPEELLSLTIFGGHQQEL